MALDVLKKWVIIINGLMKRKGDLHTITNTNGEIELVDEEEAKEEEEEMDDCSESKYDLVTIKDVDYINLDEKIYTIDETGEPDKLFGTFTNGKFQYVKKSNDKIIVKGRTKEKSIEELEAELEA